VQAGGQWRGIDTVAIRDSTGAINGIGHAAVMGDPKFRAALARHGFTLDADGEIQQLTAYIAPFSKRAAQISRQVEGYETQWRIENPDREPGPGLRRTWDTRAWAEHRPDKNTAVPADTTSTTTAPYPHERPASAGRHPAGDPLMTDQHADEHELLTITEAADITRAPLATLRYWRHLGTGPRSFRPGRRVVYRRSDLQDWITQQQSDSPSR